MTDLSADRKGAAVFFLPPLSARLVSSLKASGGERRGAGGAWAEDKWRAEKKTRMKG